MRFLFASMHSHIPDRVGGAESSTHELSLTLRDLGHETVVLCSAREDLVGPRGRHNPIHLHEDEFCGYPTFRAGQPAMALATLASRLRPDWIVLHPDKEFELESSALLTGCNLAIYVRDVEFGKHAWRIRELTHARFIANSDFTAARLKTVYGMTAHVAPPIVRRERYQSAAVASPPRDGGRVLFINPVPQKGVEVVLEIAARLPWLGFDIVEGWPVRQEQLAHYRSRAAALPNVQWHPVQQDMRPVYARAAVLIVPSQWEEAWGRVVTEAQLNGIPVIASRRGGLPEAVGDGGILVGDFGDPAAWVAALTGLLANPEMLARLRKAAVRRAEAADRPYEIAIGLVDYLMSGCPRGMEQRGVDTETFMARDLVAE
jgi:glycosyltransferase involved in cell wall biosynthesis